MALYRTRTGVDLHVDIHPTYSTDPAVPTLLFSHGLLWSGRMFAAQVTAFQASYRVVTYDHRGQGQSSVPEANFDMDTLYEDAVGLIEDLSLGPCHFAGLSMGGFVGLRLAARRPDLLRSLILLETTADPEPTENKGKYRLLNAMVRYVGMWAVVKPVMKIMFGQSFLNNPTRLADQRTWRAELLKNRRTITRAVNGVIDREGFSDELHRITLPTLIIVGEEDVATVPEKARRMQAGIAGSTLVCIPRAGHSSTIEEPEAVNAAIRAFLVNL